MAARDVQWAALIMDQRRRIYARYSPVFWRPARDAVVAHAPFLARQVEAPQVIALRTDDGFLLGELRGPEVVIDDFAVTRDDRWAADGAELLASAWGRAAAAGAARARVVTAAADAAKVAMLAGAGLTVSSQWWVKPVTPAPVEEAGEEGPLGRLAVAPPVYDPGGPVLLARDLPAVGPEDIETDAAARGAVLAVLPVAPGAAREQQLTRCGWTVASQWYLGTPAESQ